MNNIIDCGIPVEYNLIQMLTIYITYQPNSVCFIDRLKFKKKKIS